MIPDLGFLILLGYKGFGGLGFMYLVEPRSSRAMAYNRLVRCET